MRAQPIPASNPNSNLLAGASANVDVAGTSDELREHAVSVGRGVVECHRHHIVMCCLPYIRFDDLRFGPTLCPSMRRSLNPVLPYRPAIFDVHELIHRQVRQRQAISNFFSSGSRIGARQDRDRHRHPSAPCEVQLCSGAQPRADPRRNADSLSQANFTTIGAIGMGPSHAAKGGRRWRYYISRAILTGRKPDGWRSH